MRRRFLGVGALAILLGMTRDPPAKAQAAVGDSPPRDIGRLIACEEIRQLKARYCAALDDRDWPRLRTVFAEDAIFGMPGNPALEKVENPDQFVAWASDSITKSGIVATVHHVHNLRLEFSSDSEAKGEWDQENWSWFADETRPPLHILGRYSEKYRKTAAGWQIAFYDSRRIRVEGG